MMADDEFNELFSHSRLGNCIVCKSPDESKPDIYYAILKRIQIRKQTKMHQKGIFKQKNVKNLF
jgi:hypothetical protein